MARRDKLTLRQLYYRVAAARGHLLLVGTPPQIADVLERWFRAGAADGFNVMPPFFPGQFDAFVDEVVPILQERGLFRADYTAHAARPPRPEASGRGAVRRSPRPPRRRRRSRCRADDCDGQ